MRRIGHLVAPRNFEGDIEIAALHPARRLRQGQEIARKQHAERREQREGHGDFEQRDAHALVDDGRPGRRHGRGGDPELHLAERLAAERQRLLLIEDLVRAGAPEVGVPAENLGRPAARATRAPRWSMAWI